MATSSILGGRRAPSQAEGRDVGALGPSDTSDSGSDVQGELDLTPAEGFDEQLHGKAQTGLDSDSDSSGTGERGAARRDEEARMGEDIFPDRVQSLADDDDTMSGPTNAELDFVELNEADEQMAQDRDTEDDDDGEEPLDERPE